ncbi:MAG: hypothetical protein HQ514_20860 [Rhodospirillales bacterium]|nr:hypothetical protein [Rhodospirillales bacterium]
MRNLTWLAAPVLILSLALTGCGGGDVDTGELEESFSTAEPAKKATMNDVVAAVKAGDYAKAGSGLKKLASRAKLTDDQKKAISDLMSQLQEQIAQMAKNAAKEGGKAMDNLKDRMSK